MSTNVCTQACRTWSRPVMSSSKTFITHATSRPPTTSLTSRRRLTSTGTASRDFVSTLESTASSWSPSTATWTTQDEMTTCSSSTTQSTLTIRQPSDKSFTVSAGQFYDPCTYIFKHPPYWRYFTLSPIVDRILGWSPGGRTMNLVLK